MSPAPPLGSWWTDHLQLPGYDPIATAGPSRFDPRAAEQALGFFTQLLPSPLSPWEAAIVLNLWGWRQANGQRRYMTVYAEPYCRMPWLCGARPWACGCSGRRRPAGRRR